MAINFQALIEIRDMRNGGWFWIHTHVWRDQRLTQSEKVIYGTLASYSNQEQKAFPSITRVANNSGISERHTYRCLKKLEELDYLSIKRKHGKPNLYVLKKTTPDTMSPLTKDTVGGDKYAIPTPDKSTLLTTSNITRTNIYIKRSPLKFSSLKDITETDLWEISEKYRVPVSFTKLCLEKMTNWLEAKGKAYKNYKRGLMNWVLSEAQKEVERRSRNDKKRGIDARHIS